MTDEVLVSTLEKAGVLSLNRPKAIHALTVEMVDTMTEVLIAWRDDPSIELVIVDHAEGRGFCAGGDIALIRRSALEDGGAAARRFFFNEYRLNHLLFTYAKTTVAFMDGITMGGGVGISQPATFRVATENTRLAMPETGIGLFPDVGGGWYLSRLHGRIGAFLALTGARLDGSECLWSGLATHYLPSETLAEAKARIADDPSEVRAILDELSIIPPAPRIAANIEAIDRLFAPDALEDILAELELDGSQWAATELATLKTKSPQTCKVALRELSESLEVADFAQEMRMEYRIACRVIQRPDLAEGVRAVIIDKDNAPRWSPATPEEVSEDMLDAIFAPLPAEEEWSPL